MPIKDIRAVKTGLRNKYKKLRGNMVKDKKQGCDTTIAEKLFTLPQYINCSILFSYVSKDIEVDTINIIKKALWDGKLVAVPRCVTGTRKMEFYIIHSLADLEVASFGVLEPKPDCCLRATDFSHGLCIVPGLSFDKEGYRLGYGKGYYDRFLSQFKGFTAGLCYVNSVSDILPHGFFDKPVNMLITEKYISQINVDNSNGD
ncbi:MAG TPA: 5-formyltetrahydrofolate cyclo-ligase [Clostridiales bacterium]|nr:5-formyltetrahydrofolate cyclo-ligase [Clostridiales bacterium]